MGINYFSIDEEIDHFKDYLKHRIDIISNDPKRWILSNAKYQLPTFEYYLKYCVIDKGGKYDFTNRNHGNIADIKELRVKDSIVDIKKKVMMDTNFSMWMGTPFNHKSYITEI